MTFLTHQTQRLKIPALCPIVPITFQKIKGATEQPAVDPSRLASPIALAFSVPAHLMTCWRLMSRAPEGQRGYLLCPTTMTVKTCLWSSGWNLSSFFPPDSPCWMMVWKMETEAWYLNINFPDGHASPTGYLSPLLFFWGLIYSRHQESTVLLFVKFWFWISLLVTTEVFYTTGLIIFLLLHIFLLMDSLSTFFSMMKCHCQLEFWYTCLLNYSQTYSRLSVLLIIVYPQFNFVCFNCPFSTLYHSWASLKLCNVGRPFL